MVYFAYKPTGPESGKAVWTAVSKPPFLSALAIWFQSHCWCGGGLFLSNYELALNQLRYREGYYIEPDEIAPGTPLSFTALGLGQGEDDPILTHRRIRDGWIQTQNWEVTCEMGPTPPKTDAPQNEWSEWMRKRKELEGMIGYKTIKPQIMQKKSGANLLQSFERLEQFKRKIAYEVSSHNKMLLDLEDAEWADWDHRGRLVFARAGKLFACSSPKNGKSQLKELRDFNDNSFQRLKPSDRELAW